MQNAQVVHQHHTRHVTTYLPLHHICIFSHCPRTAGSASRNANSTLTMTTCALAFSYLESPPTPRSPTLVHTGLHQPGCLSAESTQHGFMQCFEQHSYQHMLPKHLAIITSLQSCHVADMFSACQQKDLDMVKCLKCNCQ